MNTKIKTLMIALVAATFTWSCTEENQDMDPNLALVTKFAGTYALPSGSYFASVGGDGVVIEDSKIPLENQTLTVIWLADSAFYLISHEFIGHLKAKASVEQDKVMLTITEQPYTGKYRNPDLNMTIAPIGQFFFQEDNGVKYLTSNDGLTTLRIYINRPSEVGDKAGTSRFEAQLRRSSRFQ